MSDYDTTENNGPDIAGNIGAFSEGALNDILFGLPEYVAKKIDRKSVEDYVNKYKKAHDIGSAAGTVGSMFIPVPGLGLVKAGAGAAKGAKAIKAAEAVTDIAKAGDTAKDIGRLSKIGKTVADAAKTGETVERVKQKIDLGKLAAQGAIAGGAESGLRGFTSEEDPSNILRDISTGATLGAGGGALGGMVSKAYPKLTQKLAKDTGAQYLAGRGFISKDLKAAFNASAPAGAKIPYRAQNVDDYVRDIVNYTKTIPRGEGVVEELSKKNTQLYKAMDDAFRKQYKGVSASDIFTNAIKPEEVAAFAEQYGDDATKKAYNFISSQSGGVKGLPEIKTHLDRMHDMARTNPKLSSDAEFSGAVQDITKLLKSKMDDIAIDAAAKGGTNIDLIDLKKRYALLKPLEQMTAREGTKITPIGGGSPTSEKNAILGILRGAAAGGAAPAAVGGTLSGTAAALMNNPEGDTLTNLRNIALASLAGAAITKGASAIGSRGIGLLDTKANKIAQAAKEIAPEALERVGAQVGGEAAAVIANNAIKAAAPQTKQEAEAAQTAAESTDEPKYLGRIMDKMKAYARAQGVDPESAEFKQFAGEVYQATNGFDPERIGYVLYDDPQEQAAYLTALKVSRELKSTMPEALKKAPGIISGATEEEKIARGASIDKLASIVGDVAKETGSEAAAKKALSKIVNSGESEERKAQLIKTLLSAYGVDLSDLEAMGVA